MEESRGPPGDKIGSTDCHEVVMIWDAIRDIPCMESSTILEHKSDIMLPEIEVK